MAIEKGKTLPLSFRAVTPQVQTLKELRRTGKFTPIPTRVKLSAEAQKVFDRRQAVAAAQREVTAGKQIGSVDPLERTQFLDVTGIQRTLGTLGPAEIEANHDTNRMFSFREESVEAGSSKLEGPPIDPVKEFKITGAFPDGTPKLVETGFANRNDQPLSSLSSSQEITAPRILGELSGKSGKIQWQVDTAIGSLHKENEDAAAVCRIDVFLRDEAGKAYKGEALLAVVCDGVSRSHGGKNASIHAAEKFMYSVLANFTCKNLSDWSTKSILDRLTKSVESTNGEIKNIEEAGNTTLAASLIVENKLYAIHAGDSRIYVIRGEQVIAMTLDHSCQQDFAQFGLTGMGLHGLSSALGRLPEENRFFGFHIAQGLIQIGLPFGSFEQTPAEQTSQDGKMYRLPHNDFLLLGKNVGDEKKHKSSLEASRTDAFHLQPNDRIFIVSDGVPFGDLLPAARIAVSGTMQAAASEAVKKARENAAYTDNATAIAISFDRKPE